MPIYRSEYRRALDLIAVDYLAVNVVAFTQAADRTRSDRMGLQGGDNVALMLGTNIFDGHGLSAIPKRAAQLRPDSPYSAGRSAILKLMAWSIVRVRR
jgi:hypothetical protein